MSSKFHKMSSILFTLIPVFFIILGLISYNKIGLDFFEVTAGDWVVGFGTFVLGFYTWILGLREIEEGKKNREVDAIDKDLREIYTKIRRILRSGQKEAEYLFLYVEAKEQLDETIQRWEYRISEEIISFWEENLKGDKAVAERDDNRIPIIYKIYHPFQKLIEEQYKIKKERYKELTSAREP